MNARTFASAALGLVLAGAAGLALGQVVDVGKVEFNASCASCHGVDGQGNGPMAAYLMGKLPNLSTLAKRNNGVFPFAHVYDTIEGTAAVKGHGSREMPVWGLRYSEKAAEHYMDYRAPYDAAAFVRGRILALTEYVYRLQQK